MPGESQQAPASVPDPTVLTTEQLLREVDGATTLLQAQIDALEKLVNAKLELIERQRVEQKADTEKAVQAALSAAKEAVKEQTTAFALATDKSERSMTEQLKQLNVTFTTAIGGAMDLLNDLKERVGRIESVKVGATGRDDRLLAFAVVVIAALALYLGTR